jgi:glycosyltransferase involved in cell wall biosynthesis
MQQDNNPLVSIIVITYNSSKFVLETLESSKAQTYQNIELIVSDDCSTDNTLDICRKWLDENASRFVRTELVTTDKNTGIAPNCNRGVKNTKGEWLKLIAGDDILDQLCIEYNVKYVIGHPDARIVFSKMKGFTNFEDIATSTIFFYNEIFEKMDVSAQIRCYLKGSQIGAGSSFLSSSLVQNMGGFDERYPMIEDYPFYLKVLLHNHRLHGLNEVTVYYRCHSDNVTKNDKKI